MHLLLSLRFVDILCFDVFLSSKGQLGVGKDVKYQNEPEAIPSDLLPRPVIQIACGETTSAAVTGTYASGNR
jgi:alpha-tubulin suppressor-like RCC1 family protein